MDPYQVVVQDLALAKEVLSSDVWVDRVFDEYIGERSWGKSLGRGILYSSHMSRIVSGFCENYA